MAFELFLQRFMPGEEFRATVTAGGNVPVYTANGMKSYVMTIGTLLGLTYFVSFVCFLFVVEWWSNIQCAVCCIQCFVDLFFFLFSP